MNSGRAMPAQRDKHVSHAITQRLPDQLNELEASVRALLQTVGRHNAELIEIEHLFNPDVFGPESLPNALTIRRRVDTVDKADKAPSDLVLYPVHPHSQSEISVGVQGVNPRLDDIDNPESEDRDSEIEPVALFHSRFNPLPASWPDDLYRATHRINVQLNSPPDEKDIAAILTTLDSMKGGSNPPLNRGNSQIILTYLDTEHSAAAKQACAAINLTGRWHAHTILIDRLSDYHALLGNTTLALQASDALSADALLAGVPCIAWRNDATQRKEATDRNDATGKLLRSLADIQFANAPLHGQTRIRYHSELHYVLQQWLTANESDDASNNLRPYNAHQTRTFSTILTPGIDADRRAELVTRLGRSLDQGQRKFNKFRESPGRFVNDSQSPLLRPFKNKRSSS